MTLADLLADAYSLADIAREAASNFRSNFGHNFPLQCLADRVAMYIHTYTLYSAVRPFGSVYILGSYSVNDGAQLYIRSFIWKLGLCHCQSKANNKKQKLREEETYHKLPGPGQLHLLARCNY